MARWTYARWGISVWGPEDPEMTAAATLSAGVVSDNVTGTVRRQVGTSGDGLSGPAVGTNPAFVGASTTGWTAGANCTLTAIADATFGPNFPNCGRMVCAAAGSGRSIRAALVNVQPDLGLAGTLLGYVEGGSTATVYVLLYDSTFVTQLASQGPFTFTGDVGAFPYAFTSAQIAGQTAPLIVIFGTDTTAQVLRVTNINPQPAGDGSIALYAAATNGVSNGGATTNTTGITESGSTTTRLATVGKFGASCFNVVTANASAAEGPYETFTATVAPWTIQARVKAAVAGGTVQLSVRDNAGVNKQSSSAVTLTTAWQTITFTTTNLTAATWRASVETSTQQALQFQFDGLQAELGSVATPYVETDGGTATRVAARCQLPQNLISSAQGWMVFRLYPGWAHGSAPNTFPRLLNAFTSLLFGGYDQAGDRWFIERDDASGSGAAATVAGTHAANAAVTVALAWTATTVTLSLNMAAFVTPVGNTKSPAAGGNLFDIGDIGDGTREIDARLMWVVGGTGAYTSITRASSYWVADADPVLSTVNADSPGAGATFVYGCSSASVLDFARDANGTWALAPAGSGTFSLEPVG